MAKLGPYTAEAKYPQALTLAAKAEGRSRSEIIRRALDHFPSTKKYLQGEVKVKVKAKPVEDKAVRPGESRDDYCTRMKAND